MPLRNGPNVASWATWGARSTGIAHAVRWFAVVVFAYYYKAVLVGFMGGVLGIEWLGGTMIHGISTNHWIEIVIYCPLLWLALHQVNENVFGVDTAAPTVAKCPPR